MTDTIKTEQPKHSDELLIAVENTLRHHNLRLKPGQDLTSIVDAMKENQVSLTTENGYLQAEMHGQPVHVNKVMESLAAKQPDRFFPRDVQGIASRDQLDNEGKLRFIRERGLAEWEKLPQTAPREVTVVLDKTKMTRAQYLSLDRPTRAQLSAQWGPDTIGKVMSRKK